MSVVARQRAVSALTFLKQRAELLERFHAANASLVVRDFVQWFEHDEVTTHVAHALLRRLSLTAKRWYDESVRLSAPAPLPQDPVECLAFRFDSLRAIKLEKFDIRYVASSFYAGSHLNEKLMAWKRAVVHPFAADLRTLADRLVPALPEGEWIELDPLLAAELDGPFARFAFGPRSWTDADDEAVVEAEKAEKNARAPGPAGAPAAPAPAPAAPAPAPGGSPSAALDELARAVETAPELGPDERADLAADVRALALELGRPRLDAGRTRERLAELEARPSLRTAAARVRELWPEA